MDILADIERVSALVCHKLPSIPSSPISIECVCLITRKFAQEKSALASFGLMPQFQQLSFDMGVIRSDGNNQALSLVTGETSRKVRYSEAALLAAQHAELSSLSSASRSHRGRSAAGYPTCWPRHLCPGELPGAHVRSRCGQVRRRIQ